MMRKATTIFDEAGKDESLESDLITLDPKTTHILARLHAENVDGTLPTLDVVVQHSPDQVNWTNILTFTQVTTSNDANEDKQFKISDGLIFPYLRATATIGGTTPEYDFSLIIYEGA
jgi:hypothetical protein